jgi:hypothetical protein
MDPSQTNCSLEPSNADSDEKEVISTTNSESKCAEIRSEESGVENLPKSSDKGCSNEKLPDERSNENEEISEKVVDQVESYHGIENPSLVLNPSPASTREISSTASQSDNLQAPPPLAAPVTRKPKAHPAVAEPEPFPNPIIRRSHLRKVNIRITDTIVEQKLIIHSLSGRFYEIGATLKKAIFGHVIHAILLKPSESNPDEFQRTNQQMAIKVYSKRMLRQLQGRTQENPLMEITALQYIGNDHPNLMGQIECCTDEENIYSVMRYCQGGELFDFIDENGPLTNEQAKKMFKQLVNGLARLQELGIGHRDMSLENILYDRNEIYVIIDFGMCLRLKKNPETGEYYFINRQQICGKKNYIAPEVLREDPTFNPMIADIWAAGIILFIILTGVPPIDKATHADIRYTMICEGRLQEMVNNWGIDMNSEVVDLIQKLLKADPLERLTIDEILSHEWMRDA